MDDDLKAMEAAKLYAEDATFQHIADELDISKSHAQTMVRRGIAILETEKVVNTVPVDNPGTQHMSPQNNPGTQHGFPIQPIPLSYKLPAQPIAVDPHSRHNYELELTAIDKKLTMTGYEILIYDIFCNNGYAGTFSDFCREGIHLMYSAIPPQGRAM